MTPVKADTSYITICMKPIHMCNYMKTMQNIQTTVHICMKPSFTVQSTYRTYTNLYNTHIKHINAYITNKPFTELSKSHRVHAQALPDRSQYWSQAASAADAVDGRPAGIEG